MQQVGDFQLLGGILHPPVDLGLTLFTNQPKGHVLVDGHMRIERIVLKHHGDTAIFGHGVVNAAVVDHDLAFTDAFQSGNHAQQGGFGAAGRADKHHKLSVLDIQIHAMQRPETVGIDLFHTV
ncbi:hypothetical protein D3C79_754040 [compost metagenome]